MTPLLGVQLYSLREDLAKDFDGVIRRVAEMGYAGVEPWAGMTVPFAQAAELFGSLGLTSFAAHMPLLDGDDGARWLDAAALLGVQTIVLPSLSEEYFKTSESLRRGADLLNRSAETAHAAGFRYGYHNHWWEWSLIDDLPALMRFAELVNPAVIFEIDVYWAQVGGLDPAAVVAEFGDRARLLHLKDGPADNPQSPMVAAGDGVIDFPSILNGASPEWAIVELDRCATDMVVAVERSASYFLGNGFATGRA